MKLIQEVPTQCPGPWVYRSQRPQGPGMTQDDIRVSAAGQVKPQDRLGSWSVLRQGPAPYPLPAPRGHRVACRTPPDLSPCWPPGLSPPGLPGHLLAGPKLLGNEPGDAAGLCGAPGRGQDRVRRCQASLSLLFRWGLGGSQPSIPWVWLLKAPCKVNTRRFLSKPYLLIRGQGTH